MNRRYAIIALALALVGCTPAQVNETVEAITYVDSTAPTWNMAVFTDHLEVTTAGYPAGSTAIVSYGSMPPAHPVLDRTVTIAGNGAEWWLIIRDSNGTDLVNQTGPGIVASGCN